MSVSLKNLVFHPDTFFEEITYENKNLFIPLVFVALAGLFGVGELWFFAHGYPLFAIVEMMVIPFILWALVTLVIYIVAHTLSGTGSLFTTLQNIGFGMFPLTLAAAGNLRIYATVNGSPYTIADYPLPLLVMVLFPVWSWYLWYSGTRHAHRISRVKSVVAVGVVIVLQFAYWYIQVILHSGEM